MAATLILANGQQLAAEFLTAEQLEQITRYPVAVLERYNLGCLTDPGMDRRRRDRRSVYVRELAAAIAAEVELRSGAFLLAVALEG